MSDILDRARDVEMLQRDAALQNQLARAKQKTPALMIDGVRCCCDCREPILPQRLQIIPSAVRCSWCQDDFETLEKRRAQSV